MGSVYVLAPGLSSVCCRAVACAVAGEMEAGPSHCVCPLIGAHNCACPCVRCLGCKAMLLSGHDCPLKKCPCGQWMVSCQAMEEEAARSRQVLAELRAKLAALRARLEAMDAASAAADAAWEEEQAAEEAEWAALEEEDGGEVEEDEGVEEDVAPQ